MSGERPAFPWEAALHAGLCRMRLSAKDFWAMTPRELGFALGLLRPSSAAPGRAALAGLMQAFPDRME
ncbi:rcc01693 family protein [Shinella zoogloeoides]|uniref:rcc01693 family protein n=1 Tax=Shinella zoogloeoides TaxID=352475 RepID=UPI001E50BB05|nr:rcc01693 family protein [Shinella zoogloeoides]UEX83616.1 phage tail assembly chaperone [Shinella zoogloeoides]